MTKPTGRLKVKWNLSWNVAGRPDFNTVRHGEVIHVFRSWGKTWFVVLNDSHEFEDILANKVKLDD